MRILFAFIITALSFAVAPAAHAVTSMNQQSCLMPAQYANQDSVAQLHDYKTCDSRLMNAGEFFQSARLEPGYATAPIDIHGICRWVDNYSTQAMFVPAGTPEEWTAFVNNKPNDVETTSCCHDVTYTNYQTCGQAVVLPYGREGVSQEIKASDVANAPLGNAGRTVTYQCAGGEWHFVGDNGQPCDAAAGPNGAPGFVRNVQQPRAIQAGWAVQRNFTN